MKKILSALLCFSLLFSLTACGKSKEAEKPTTEEEKPEQSAQELYPGLSAHPEELLEEKDYPLTASERLVVQCVEAMFTPDAAAIFDLWPPELSEYFLNLKGYTDTQYQTALDAYQAAMQSSVDKIDAMYDDWTVDVEFLAQRNMTTEQLRPLNKLYGRLKYQAEAGRLMDVQISILADGKEIPLQKTTFACVQISGQWYLDDSNTVIIPEPEEPTSAAEEAPAQEETQP